MVNVTVVGIRTPPGVERLAALRYGDTVGRDHYWFDLSGRTPEVVADGVVTLLREQGIQCERVRVGDLGGIVTREMGVLDRIVEATS